MCTMRRMSRSFHRLAALAAFAAATALAAAASADKLLFSGEHAIKFAHNGVIKEVSASGTGVAIANGKAGPLGTVQLTRPFAKITETVFATTTGEGLEEIHFDGVRIDPSRAGADGAPGVFAPILAAVKGTTMTALTRSTLPAAGQIRLCNLTGCGTSLVLNLAQSFMGAAIGPGVGGTITASNPHTPASMGGTKVTAVGKPWTVNTTTVKYCKGGCTPITTMTMPNPATNTRLGTFMDKGSAKGPLGNTGTTLDTIMGTTTLGAMTIMGGQLQLVSGVQTTCVGCGSTNSPTGLITRLTINFAPEPGLLALLGAGAAGLALLGRTRARR